MQQISQVSSRKIKKLRQKVKQKTVAYTRYLIKGQAKLQKIQKTITDYNGSGQFEIDMNNLDQQVKLIMQQCLIQLKDAYKVEDIQENQIKQLEKEIQILNYYGNISHLNYLIEKKILQAIIWPKLYSLTWDDIYKETIHIVNWSVRLRCFNEYFPGNEQVLNTSQLKQVYMELKKPIDSSKIWLYLNNKIEKYQNHQQVILLIGGTGVGKTTLIKNLLGYRHQPKHDKQNNLWCLQTTFPLKEQHKQLIAKISAQSVTSDIHIIKLDCEQLGRQTLIADCPGLNDTRGKEVELANNYLRDKFLQRCGKILVIQMVKIDDLLDGRKNSVSSYAKYLKKQYNYGDESELAKHLILLYNYSDPEKSAAVLSLIQKQRRSEKDQRLRIAYTFMENQISKSQYHIRKKSLDGRLNDQQDFQQLQRTKILEVIKSKSYVQTNMFINNFIQSQEYENLLYTIQLSKEKMQYYLGIKKIREAKYQLITIKQLFKCYRDLSLQFSYQNCFLSALGNFYNEAIQLLSIEDKSIYFLEEQYQKVKKANQFIKEIQTVCFEFNQMKCLNEKYQNTLSLFLNSISDLIINKDRLDQKEVDFFKKYFILSQNDTQGIFANRCIFKLQNNAVQIHNRINLLEFSLNFGSQLKQIEEFIRILQENEILVQNLKNIRLSTKHSTQCVQQLELKLRILTKNIAMHLAIHKSHFVQQVEKKFQQYYSISFEYKSLEVLQCYNIFHKAILQNQGILKYINGQELVQALVDFMKTVLSLYRQFSKFLQKLQNNQKDLSKALIVAMNFKKDMSQIFQFELLNKLHPSQLTGIKDQIYQLCKDRLNQMALLKKSILKLIQRNVIEVELQEIKQRVNKVARFIMYKEFYKCYLQSQQGDQFETQLLKSLEQKYGQLSKQQQCIRNANKLMSFYIQINNIAQITANLNLSNQTLAKVQFFSTTFIDKVNKIKQMISQNLKKHGDLLKVLSQQLNPDQMIQDFRNISEMIKKEQKHQKCKQISCLKTKIILQFEDFLRNFEQKLDQVKLANIFDKNSFNENQHNRQIRFLCRIIQFCSKLKTLQLFSCNKNYDLKSTTQFIQKIIKAVNNKFDVLDAQFKDGKLNQNTLKQMIKDLYVYDEVCYYMNKYFEGVAKVKGGISQKIRNIKVKIKERILQQMDQQLQEIKNLFTNFQRTQFSEIRFSYFWKKIKSTEKSQFFVKQHQSYIQKLVQKNFKLRRSDKATEEDALQLQKVLDKTLQLKSQIKISEGSINKLINQIQQQRNSVETKIRKYLNQAKHLTEQFQFQKANEQCNKVYRLVDHFKLPIIEKQIEIQKNQIRLRENRIKEILQKQSTDQYLMPEKISSLSQRDFKYHTYLIVKKPSFANKIKLNFKKQTEQLINQIQNKSHLDSSDCIKLAKNYQKFYEYSEYAYENLRIPEFFEIKQSFKNILKSKLHLILKQFLRRLENLSSNAQRQALLVHADSSAILQLSQVYPQMPEYKQIQQKLKNIYLGSINQLTNSQNIEQAIKLYKRMKEDNQKISNNRIPLIIEVSQLVGQQLYNQFQSILINIIHEIDKNIEKKNVEVFKLPLIIDFLAKQQGKYKDLHRKLSDSVKNLVNKYSCNYQKYLSIGIYVQKLPQQYMSLGQQIENQFRLCYNYQKLKEIIEDRANLKRKTKLFLEQLKNRIVSFKSLSFQQKSLLFIDRKKFINKQAQQQYIFMMKKEYLLLKVISENIKGEHPLYTHFSIITNLNCIIRQLIAKIMAQMQKHTKDLEAIIYKNENKQVNQRIFCLVPYFEKKRSLFDIFLQHFAQLKSLKTGFIKEGSNQQKQLINKKHAQKTIVHKLFFMKKISMFKFYLMEENQSLIKSHLKQIKTSKLIQTELNKQTKNHRRFIYNKILSQNSSFQYHVSNLKVFLEHHSNVETANKLFKQYVEFLKGLVQKSPSLQIFSLKNYYLQKCKIYQPASIVLSIITYLFPNIPFYQNSSLVIFLNESLNGQQQLNLSFFQNVLVKISSSQKQILKMFISLYFMLKDYDVYLYCNCNYDQERIKTFLCKNLQKQQKFQLFQSLQQFIAKRNQIILTWKFKKGQNKQIIVLQAEKIINFLLDNKKRNQNSLNHTILGYLQQFQLYTLVCSTPYQTVYEGIKSILPQIKVFQKISKRQNFQFSIQLTQDKQLSSVAKRIISQPKANLVVCFKNSEQLQLFLDNHMNLLAPHYQSFVLIDKLQDEKHIRELKLQTMGIFVNILLITTQMFMEIKRQNHLYLNQKEIQFILTYLPDFYIEWMEIRSILNSISSRSTFKIVVLKSCLKKNQIAAKKHSTEVDYLKQLLKLNQNKALHEIFNLFNSEVIKTNAKIKPEE